MSEFKVGDKVVLRPETKPYTYESLRGDKVEKSNIPKQDIEYTITEIDGKNLVIKGVGHHDIISPHHLKYSKKDYNDNPYRFEYAVGDFDNPRSRLNDQIQDLQEFKITPFDNEELRFMIYHGNPSRTLEEMQAIENWLLGEK